MPLPAAVAAVLPLLLQPLNVYRNGKWGKLPGDALVPGDVVSVVRSGGFSSAQVDVVVGLPWSGYVVEWQAGRGPGTQRQPADEDVGAPAWLQLSGAHPLPPAAVCCMFVGLQRAGTTWCCKPICCCWQGPSLWTRRC